MSVVAPHCPLSRVHLCLERGGEAGGDVRQAGTPGQQPSRPGNPSPHRELFLLLGSTPLKVVVVVMAPKSEVGWRIFKETNRGL